MIRSQDPRASCQGRTAAPLSPAVHTGLNGSASAAAPSTARRETKSACPGALLESKSVNTVKHREELPANAQPTLPLISITAGKTQDITPVSKGLRPGQPEGPFAGWLKQTLSVTFSKATDLCPPRLFLTKPSIFHFVQTSAPHPWPRASGERVEPLHQAVTRAVAAPPPVTGLCGDKTLG